MDPPIQKRLGLADKELKKALDTEEVRVTHSNSTHKQNDRKYVQVLVGGAMPGPQAPAQKVLGTSQKELSKAKEGEQLRTEHREYTRHRRASQEKITGE